MSSIASGDRDLGLPRGPRLSALEGRATARLESELEGLRSEFDQVVNRVTAEALKRKAAQLGQIKEITEDARDGSMTIFLEV